MVLFSTPSVDKKWFIAASSKSTLTDQSKLVIARTTFSHIELGLKQLKPPSSHFCDIKWHQMTSRDIKMTSRDMPRAGLWVSDNNYAYSEDCILSLASFTEPKNQHQDNYLTNVVFTRRARLEIIINNYQLVIKFQTIHKPSSGKSVL